jgi:hypothetical protein
MTIKKMLMLASMALAAIAFAAPAVAQADVELTEKGTPVAVGADVTATSTNLETATSTGTLSCEKVTLHFEVDANGPEHVVLDPIGEATTEGCEVTENGFSVTITDGTITENLTINTWGTGEVGATFISDVYSPLDPEHLGPPALSCHFAGKVHAEGAASGSDILNVGPSILAGTGTNCANAGQMTGEFTMETEDGTPVELDFVETG